MKQLRDLTEKEYNKLDKIGMLYVLYPEATGEYMKDMGKTHPLDLFKIGDYVMIVKVLNHIDFPVKCVDINNYGNALFIHVNINKQEYVLSDSSLIIEKLQD